MRCIHKTKCNTCFLFILNLPFSFAYFLKCSAFNRIFMTFVGFFSLPPSLLIRVTTIRGKWTPFGSQTPGKQEHPAPEYRKPLCQKWFLWPSIEISNQMVSGDCRMKAKCQQPWWIYVPGLTAQNRVGINESNVTGSRRFLSLFVADCHFRQIIFLLLLFGFFPTVAWCAGCVCVCFFFAPNSSDCTLFFLFFVIDLRHG